MNYFYPYYHQFCWVILFLAFFSAANAQIDTSKTTYFLTTPDKLLDSEDTTRQTTVSIAAKSNLSIEQTPSVISLITQEDIARYGCRDIADALRMIPGFEFGIDVNSLIGLGFRGVWVHEGKYLIMVNGMPLNDLGYGNYNFMGSIPLASVEKIEIVRGSGSILYGSFAEIATINIITKTGETLKGLELSSQMGLVGNEGFARQFNLTAGSRFRDIEISLTAGFNARPLASGTYEDFFGNQLALNRQNTDRKFNYLYTKIKYRNLKISYNRSSFEYIGMDGADQVVPILPNQELPEHLNHTIQNTLIEYTPSLGARTRVGLLAEITQGNTATTSHLAASTTGTFNFIGGVDLRRYRGEASLIFDFAKSGELTIGTGYTRDDLHNNSALGYPGFWGGRGTGDSVLTRYTESLALFGQYVGVFGKFGVTSGIRYENTTFGQATAGRAGLTFSEAKFNAKLLIGQSFRIPLGWQAFSRDLTYNPDLITETAHTVDLELGYKFSDNWSFKLNGFFINIINPIVYTGVSNAYINAGKVQTLGLESELNFKTPKYGGFINLSWARPTAETSPDFRDSDKLMSLGLPPIKLNGGAFYKIQNFSFSPQVTWLSSRAGQTAEYARGETDDAFDSQTYPSVLLLNLNIAYLEPYKGVDFNLSVHNLLDTQYLLIQPYYGGHAPILANSRQIMAGIKLKF
ncbi:MAG: TonB-dependent receptor plug domain-containing protein [Microscillaceae bacterium]|jgi:outer membrane receptor protein involved in Fe transport|nr:TonB-dependent receptor plug domain-containing protein [Microscillaceae bacterium]